MTKEERKEQERFEKAHPHDVYDKEGYWSHLSSLGVIHYSTIDLLVVRELSRTRTIAYKGKKEVEGG
jgi:hypothetical protein